MLKLSFLTRNGAAKVRIIWEYAIVLGELFVFLDFTSKEVLSTYDLGSKSNISRIKTVLTQKELIEKTPNGIVFSDPVFELWFTKEWCK